MAKAKWIRGSGRRRIWISAETHWLLEGLKRKNESFDSVVRRLIGGEVKELRGY